MSIDQRRQWRTVALSSQIGVGKPVRVPCGADDYVLFRDSAGTCRALIDRCAHRRAPLSLGRLTDQCLIECPYHGWRYEGASGACVVIPNLRADEKVPKSYRVQAYETFERDGFIQLLFGSDESSSEPEPLALPALDHAWEGERLLAYPDQLLMETLVDCPDAILAIDGIRIINDHRYGDPTLQHDRLVVQYAALDAQRARRPPKRAIADFPYLVRVSASKTTARVELYAGAQLRSTAVLVAIPQGNRLTRVLWRGSGNASGEPSTIACTAHINASAVSTSNYYVSRAWAEAVATATVG